MVVSGLRRCQAMGMNGSFEHFLEEPAPRQVYSSSPSALCFEIYERNSRIRGRGPNAKRNHR
jgi:hypothetical protein